MPSAIILLTNGFEEMEAIAPADILRRANIQTTLVSTTDSLELIGRNNIRILADVLLSQLPDTDQNALIIPGGPGHTEHAENEEVLNLIRQFQDQGKLVASICAGPVVLEKAGIINARKFTSHHTTASKLKQRDADKAVVVDGNLITSQGAGTAHLFGLAIVEYLLSPEIADNISVDIAAHIAHPRK